MINIILQKKNLKLKYGIKQEYLIWMQITKIFFLQIIFAKVSIELWIKNKWDFVGPCVIFKIVKKM